MIVFSFLVSESVQEHLEKSKPEAIVDEVVSNAFNL